MAIGVTDNIVPEALRAEHDLLTRPVRFLPSRLHNRDLLGVVLLEPADYSYHLVERYPVKRTPLWMWEN